MPALPPKACICPAFSSKQNLSPCWVRRSTGESILDCSSILNAFQLFPSNSIQTPWLGRESSFQTFTPAWGWGVGRGREHGSWLDELRAGAGAQRSRLSRDARSREPAATGAAPPPREASPAALSRDTRRRREHEGRRWLTNVGCSSMCAA